MNRRLGITSLVVAVVLLAAGFVIGRTTATDDDHGPERPSVAEATKTSACANSLATAQAAVEQLEQSLLQASAATGAGGVTGAGSAALADARGRVDEARSQLQGAILRCAVEPN